VRLPSIPIATDLPSLIRTVNIINDVLRSITTSLTVNNVWLPSPPAVPPTVMSPYPNWFEVTTDTSTGYVYNKSKNGTDPKQRAAVRRTDMVEYMDESGEPFFWRYSLKLDLKQGTSNPFIEDFFERIVNVRWGVKVQQQWLLGKVPRSISIDFTRPADSWTAVTAAGQTFKGVSSGASLQGYTVLSKGCVAAGKIVDPITHIAKDVFMVVGGSGPDVQFGVVDDQGALKWTPSGFALPGELIGASFAGNAFFIAYYSDSFTTRFAVSLDAATFNPAIIPFPSAESADNGAFGGPPAFLNGVYCAAGSFFVDDGDGHTAINLMWSTSKDGVTWSDGHDSTLIDGVGADNANHQSCIAAGNLTFGVAAAVNHKSPTAEFPTADEWGIVPQAALATSSSGDDWSAAGIGEWRSSWELGDRGSAGVAVCFVKAPPPPTPPTFKPPPDNGFFVVAGWTQGGPEIGPGGLGNPLSNLWVNGTEVMTSSTEWFAALSTIDAKPDPKKTIIK
jgi:hypothetical protein